MTATARRKGARKLHTGGIRAPPEASGHHRRHPGTTGGIRAPPEASGHHRRHPGTTGGIRAPPEASGHHRRHPGTTGGIRAPPEASGHHRRRPGNWLGPRVFNTGGWRSAPSAGSIPVRLRRHHGGPSPGAGGARGVDSRRAVAYQPRRGAPLSHPARDAVLAVADRTSRGGAPGLVHESAAVTLPEPFGIILRGGDPAVVGWVGSRRLLLDLRAVPPECDEEVQAAVHAAAATVPAGPAGPPVDLPLPGPPMAARIRYRSGLPALPRAWMRRMRRVGKGRPRWGGCSKVISWADHAFWVEDA